MFLCGRQAQCPPYSRHHSDVARDALPGYVESSAVGLMAGMMTAAELAGEPWTAPPSTSAMGALLSHITGDAEASDYQPMNINFGLFPPLHDVKKKDRKQAYTSRAKDDFGAWLAGLEAVPA